MLESLPADRGMHVRGVAGEQDPPVAVGRGLPGRVGEAGEPGGTVDPVVGPVDGDQRLAEVVQGRLARGSDVPLGDHDPDRPAVRVDDLAVADLVVHPADAVRAERVAADPHSGSSAISASAIRELVVGSHPGTRSRRPCGPGCARRRSRRDSAPAATGRRRARRRRRVVLREARHLESAVDRHPELVDPAGEDPLDVVLPEPERVGMPGGKVADVQGGPGELPPSWCCSPAPPRGIDRRSRAGRGSRSCVSAGRRRASRRDPGWRAARRSATSTPASASSPASISPVGPPPAITTACSFFSGISRLQSRLPSRSAAVIRHGPGPHEGLESAINSEGAGERRPSFPCERRAIRRSARLASRADAPARFLVDYCPGDEGESACE